MVTLYWRGGAATWDTTAGLKWDTVSGGPGGHAKPTSVDDVVIDAANGGSSAIAIGTSGVSCRNLTFTGFTGTITGGGTSVLNIFGDLTLASGMTITSTGTFSFGGAGTHSITFAGVSIPGTFSFGASTAVWNIQDAWTSTGTITHSGGTINLNNQTCNWAIYNSDTGGGTRVLNPGTSIVTVSGSVAAPWTAGTSANFSIGNTNWILKLNKTSAGTKTFAGGGQSYGTVWFLWPTTGTWSVTGNNSYDFIKTTAPNTIGTLQFAASSAQAVTDWQVAGSSAGLLTVKSASGTFDLVSSGNDFISDYIDLTGSHASGGIFYAGSSSVDSGSNTGWSFFGPPLSASATQLVPSSVQVGTLEGTAPPASVSSFQLIASIGQSGAMVNLVPPLVTADQLIPVVASVGELDAEVQIAHAGQIPALTQAVTASLTAAVGAIQIIPAVDFFAVEVVEIRAGAVNQIIPDLTQVATVFGQLGLIANQAIPAVVTASALETLIVAEVDQSVPPLGLSQAITHQSVAEAVQQIPEVSQYAQVRVSWVSLAPDGIGAQLLYRTATGLERSMADADADQIWSIEAELIIKNWDPYQVLSRNIPFLAFGMGVTLWEDDYWNEVKKRRWLAQQWDYKSIRGTIGGIRMALDVSDYVLTDFLTPPQGFYASPNLPPEKLNQWIRLMPELRFTYGPKRGVAFWSEWFEGDGFAGDSMVGLADGFALRGRYAFLRHNGVVTPLDIIYHDQAREARQGMSFERVSVRGESSLGFFAGESAAGDSWRFAGQAELEPRIFTVEIDEAFSVDVTKVQLTTLTPTLDPIRPSFEVNSDMGDGNSWFFIGDFCAEDKFVDWEDGGAFLLAQRMYLLDPVVAAPMTLGSSFSGVDRVNMPTYCMELMIDLGTHEDLPTIFAADTFVGTNYASREDTSHIDRAIRAVVDAKALRDTALITFAPKRLVQMGDYLTAGTSAPDYVTNTL